ncbi:MAG: cytochrome c oxidase accessory protein CcoG, partial [Mesorhizobium sp.]
VKLLNMIPEPRTIEVTLQGLDGGEMSIVGIDQPSSRTFAVAVEPDRLNVLKVFVRQPTELIKAPVQSFEFRIADKASSESAQYTASFNAPENRK